MIKNINALINYHIGNFQSIFKYKEEDNKKRKFTKKKKGGTTILIQTNLKIIEKPKIIQGHMSNNQKKKLTISFK